MKILQVVHGFPPQSNAGAEKYTYFLSQELSKRHEVHVLYPVSSKSYLSINSKSKNNLQLHELSICRQINFFSAICFTNSYLKQDREKKFRHFLHELNPDIVHFQHCLNLSSSYINVTKELKIPSVITLHDFWFLCPTVQLFRDTDQLCSGPNAPSCKKCWITKRLQTIIIYLKRYHIPPFLCHRFIKYALNTANSIEKFRERESHMKTILLQVNKIIAPSYFLKEIFVKSGIPKEKIIHSENGYQGNLFEDYKKETDLCKVTFGFIGRVVEIKGVHILIDAFLEVPNENAELRIYGAYDKKDTYVKQLLYKSKHKSNIKFMGQTDDISAAFSKIDVLVFPSIWYENCPLVLAERQLTHTPVIASKLGAIPEFVEDGVDGFLFDPKDIHELSSNLVKFIKNPSLSNKMSTNITRYPKTIEQQSKEIESIYIQCIEEMSQNES